MLSRTPRSRRVLAALTSTLLLAVTLGFSTVTTSAPAAADVNDGWTVIDVGLNHTCGVTTVGEAYCWGLGNDGALGNGQFGQLAGHEPLPLLVAAPPGVTWATIDVGEVHTCALTTDGDLYCWGSDGLEGNLGNGIGVDGEYFYPTPGLVDTPPGVTWAQVSAGRHSCALTTTGDAYCWGPGEQGQLGNGAAEGQQSPVLVTAPPGVVWAEIAVGSTDTNNFGSRHTCAVSTTGAGYCWGADNYGQLGDGSDLVDASTPSAVDTPPGVQWQSIDPGRNHTCGVTTTGAGYCWGRSAAGRLGVGELEPPVPLSSPAEVVTPTGVTWAQIDPAGAYTCGLTTQGELYCWGSEGGAGTFGDGPGMSSSDVPVLSPLPGGISAWTLVSTGENHTCAVAGDATGWCWGRDLNGTLGNGGTDTDSDVPVLVVAEEPTGGPQTITFNFAGERPLAESPIAILARTDSLLPITFTSQTPAVCAVDDSFELDGATRGVLDLLTAGTCTITASQPGDGLWDPAVPQTRSVEVVGATADPAGLLRVTTDPAVPAEIIVDGIPRDSWGLNWVAFPLGTYEVCFGPAPGYTPPPCQNIEVHQGQTTTVVGTYVRRGTLRVLTSPAVPSTITIDGAPANDWGVWTDLVPGTYQVCFGAVAGHNPPGCQNAVVTAGSTTTITGNFPTNAAAPGPDPNHGFLRATTNPAVASRITIDGHVADTWGLTWLKLAPGDHQICFETVLYTSAPACQNTTVTAGATTTITGNFFAHGFLRVLTAPAVGVTITIDGEPANAWGVWTSKPPGLYEVCYGSVDGLTTPPCQEAIVASGATTTLTGTYT